LKKVLILLVTVLTLICFCACGDKPETPVVTDGTPVSSDPAPDDNPTGDGSDDRANYMNDRTFRVPDKVDIDLTEMSSSLVYSEVYNIVTEPTEYLGKVIKVAGTFNASYFEPTDNYYYYVIVQDATACCANGIEFIWNGQHDFPNEYPDNGDTIEITGVFGQYEEEGITYYYLLTDQIEVPSGL